MQRDVVERDKPQALLWDDRERPPALNTFV